MSPPPSLFSSAHPTQFSDRLGSESSNVTLLEVALTHLFPRQQQSHKIGGIFLPLVAESYDKEMLRRAQFDSLSSSILSTCLEEAFLRRRCFLSKQPIDALHPQSEIH